MGVGVGVGVGVGGTGGVGVLTVVTRASVTAPLRAVPTGVLALKCSSRLWPGRRLPFQAVLRSVTVLVPSPWATTSATIVQALRLVRRVRKRTLQPRSIWLPVLVMVRRPLSPPQYSDPPTLMANGSAVLKAMDRGAGIVPVFRAWAEWPIRQSTGFWAALPLPAPTLK